MEMTDLPPGSVSISKRGFTPKGRNLLGANSFLKESTHMNCKTETNVH